MTTEPYILYIEDERPAIDLVRKILMPTGFHVTGVTNGREGIAMMHRHKPVLLLLDLMMPGTSGFDVYQEIKDDPELCDIPVIVITAKVPNRGCFILEDLPPVDDYITKPFKLRRLIRAVCQVLAAEPA